MDTTLYMYKIFIKNNQFEDIISYFIRIFPKNEIQIKFDNIKNIITKNYYRNNNFKCLFLCLKNKYKIKISCLHFHSKMKHLLKENIYFNNLL